LKVITLNVNGIRSAATKGLFRWLEKQQADVVCLQELKCHEADLDAKLHGLKAFESCRIAKKRAKAASPYSRAARRGEARLRRASSTTRLPCRARSASLGDLYMLSPPARTAVEIPFPEEIPDPPEEAGKESRSHPVRRSNIAHQQIDLKNRARTEELGLSAGAGPGSRACSTRSASSMCSASSTEARPVHLVVEPRPGGRRTSAGASTIRSPRPRGATANKESIYKAQRFSDHAPLTIDYSGLSGLSHLERAPLAALFLGLSSGFAFAMIGRRSPCGSRSIQQERGDGLCAHLPRLQLVPVAPLVDNAPVILGRFGQRRSWLWLVGVLVMAAVAFLGFADPAESVYLVAVAAVTLGVAGATFDIIIDAYRIELLEPRQLGVGSGMSQYGWRLGSAAAGALALVLAARIGWTAAYVACAAFALPAMLVGVFMGEPARHRAPAARRGVMEALVGYFSPLSEFMQRQGAVVVLLFVLIHKIGDAANPPCGCCSRTCNDEVAFYDVGVGFAALLIGIFVGGVLCAARHEALGAGQPGADGGVEPELRRAGGRGTPTSAAAVGFENFASGIDGVTVVAYLSTAACASPPRSTRCFQRSPASPAASDRNHGGGLITAIGYVNFT
jgi:PAT family beta-lactamase induction signal transducer AmpG